MGKLNQKLAEDLKFTAKMNRKLVEHYYSYPDIPEGFPQWQNTLNSYLAEAFAKFK
jgi:hypothetical protein